MEIRVRNVNDALPTVLQQLLQKGHSKNSRNGGTTVFDGPVMTTYLMPDERVLLNPVRDANPFFHLMESLWMLAGRDDVKFIEKFVKRMRTFSDDGKTMHGAYGRRWRSWFGYDQLKAIAQELRDRPDSRRAVLTMWSPGCELDEQLGGDLAVAAGGGKDVPCNTQAFFKRGVDGRLDMTLINRSNDIIWGAYGANAVHFSYLHEYMAAATGMQMGRMFQFSNDFHAYVKVLQPLVDKGVLEQPINPYATTDVAPFPMVSTPIEQWDQDLALFMEAGPTPGLRDPFFTRVVVPMWVAHAAYKKGEFEHAHEALGNCEASDWKLAAEQWLHRREAERG